MTEQQNDTPNITHQADVVNALRVAALAPTVSKVEISEGVLFNLTDNGLLREVRGIQDENGIRILYEITEAGRAALQAVS